MSSFIQRRLLKGLAAQGFGQVVNLLIQVCSVPIYLHYWGRTLYGEWLLLSSVLSYLSMSDLSFGNAAQNEMNMCVGRGDKVTALSVFQSCWLLVTVISLSFMVICLLAVPLLPFGTWLHLKHLSHGETIAVLDLLILQTILAQQGGILGAGFSCDGNYARSVMYGNSLRLAEFTVGAITLVSHGTLWTMALSVFVVRLAGYALMYRLLRRLSPWLYIGRRHASLEVVRPLVKPALSYNLFPFAGALSMQGMVTIIGIYLGPDAVTLFSTSRTLTRLAIQPVNAMTNTIWVELSYALGARDIPLARSLHRRASQIAFWFGLSAVGALLVIGQPIYRIWTHGKIPFNPGLFHLLLLVVLASSLWSISYTVPMSINRHSRLAVVCMIMALLDLPLGWLLVRSLGIQGAAAMMLCEEIILLLYVLPRSLCLLDDNFRSYAGVILTPPIGWLRAKLFPAQISRR